MKETVHIKFADGLWDNLNLPPQIKVDKRMRNLFLLGSFAPDVFFMSKKTWGFADKIHGAKGEDTSVFPKEILSSAIQKQNWQLFVFGLGYITHMLLDIHSHPKIYALTGNYYDSNQSRQRNAVFGHRLLESQISILHNATDAFKNVKLNWHAVKTLPNIKSSFAKQYKISSLPLSFLFAKSMLYNKYIFVSNFAFLIMKSFLSIENLTFFYAFAKKQEFFASDLDNTLEAPDLFDKNKSCKFTINSIFTQAKKESLSIINKCIKSFVAQEDQLLEELIPSKSLDTGNRRSVHEIKYFKQIFSISDAKF